MDECASRPTARGCHVPRAKGGSSQYALGAGGGRRPVQCSWGPPSPPVGRRRPRSPRVPGPVPPAPRCIRPGQTPGRLGQFGARRAGFPRRGRKSPGPPAARAPTPRGLVRRVGDWRHETRRGPPAGCWRRLRRWHDEPRPRRAIGGRGRIDGSVSRRAENSSGRRKHCRSSSRGSSGWRASRSTSSHQPPGSSSTSRRAARLSRVHCLLRRRRTLLRPRIRPPPIVTRPPWLGPGRFARSTNRSPGASGRAWVSRS